MEENISRMGSLIQSVGDPEERGNVRASGWPVRVSCSWVSLGIRIPSPPTPVPLRPTTRVNAIVYRHGSVRRCSRPRAYSHLKLDKVLNKNHLTVSFWVSSSLVMTNTIS